MIVYLVSQKHHHTLSRYLASWGQGIASGVRIVPYATLPGLVDLPGGAYIFSDLERLNATQRELLAGLHERLAAAGADVRTLNHPSRSLRRRELLTALHQAGTNTFRAFRPNDPARPWRFPVFLREEREHNGARSDLITREEDLQLIALKMVMDGHALDDLLVVEFCDTSDTDGLFRKYSSFIVGDQIIARHILFSRKWMLKDRDLFEPSHREEVLAYCHDNPHEDALRDIFRRAQIDYGRIDYSVDREGRLQVWEINTNPIVMKPPSEYAAASMEFHTLFSERFASALVALDPGAPEGVRIPTPWMDTDVWNL